MNLSSYYYDLESEKFHLRRWRKSDVQDLFILLSNDHVLKYFLMKPMESILEADLLLEDYLLGIENGTSMRWVVADSDTDEMMGMAGFREFDHPHLRGEIGYGILPKYWGKGVTTDVVRLLVEFGFQVLRLHTIEAQVLPDNSASRKVLEKVGFHQEGYFKENIFFNGKFHDTVFYSILDHTDKTT